MKKQKIQFLVLGILLVLVIAAFPVIQKLNDRRAEAEKEETEPSYTVLTLEEADIDTFSFTNENGSYTFYQSSDQQAGWHCKEDETILPDSEKISSLLARVLTLQADARIENVTDMEQYGLTDSEITVSITTSNGVNYQILFGNYNEFTYQYYFALKGESVVYTSDANIGYGFEITPEDLKQEMDITEE